jgi:hypothetical protein
MLRSLPPALLLAASSLVACAGRDSQPAASESTAVTTATTASGTPYAYDRIPLDTSRRPDAVIDSVFPMPEMLRRFRVGLPAVRTLDGGAPSRQALVAQFAAALAAQDKATLGRLTLSRAEFAYLYFPHTPDAELPNGLPPTLRWDQITLSSEKGIARALDRIGGKGALTLTRLDCPNPPVSQGPVTLHDGCTVRLTKADGSEFNGRLFGPILEYAGRFKFIGYSNDM